MFSAWQLRNWTTTHLQSCPWYIECNIGFIPPEEAVLFNTLKDTSHTTEVEPKFDEFAGLDPEARAKAIAKRDAFDKKKLERLEEAEKKTDEMKLKRLATKAEKEQEKANKKGKKRKAETPLQEPATSTADLKDTSSSFSLTQDRLVLGLTPTLHQNPDAVPAMDECILNLSLRALSRDDKALEAVEAFLAMVFPI